LQNSAIQNGKGTEEVIDRHDVVFSMLNLILYNRPCCAPPIPPLKSLFHDFPFPETTSNIETTKRKRQQPMTQVIARRR